MSAQPARVVVTGVGLVTPCGVGREETWGALLEGRSGAGPITLFELPADLPVRFACEVKGFEPAAWVPRRRVKELCRFSLLALAAARLALDQAEPALSDEERERAGVYIGVGLGGLEGLERWSLAVHQRGARKVSPYFIPSVVANLAAGQVSIAFGLRGPSLSPSSACASGAHAIGEAARLIRAGDAEVMLAGGAEATITAVGMAGFAAMGALSRRNDAPERASRPFDRDRDGFVCGEGAGVLVLESAERARRRGAPILAELTGYGATSDAHHPTQPAEDGAGAAACMRRALASARLAPDRIGYLNAHGTSTPLGDRAEACAIASVFGEHATGGGLWVSSTKSMTGHLLGAAGAVEAGLTALCLRDGRVPPTLNLEQLDPECRLDCVPQVARERRLDHAVSNAFGFGGSNAALVLSRYA